MNILIIGAEGVGKTTLADNLQLLSGNLYNRMAYADMPRVALADEMGWPEFVELSKDQATKNVPHERLDGLTPRQALIEYSEKCKEQDPLVWTRLLCERIEEDDRPFLVDDVRFWHEVAPYTLRPTLIVWITKPGRTVGSEREYQLPALADWLLRHDEAEVKAGNPDVFATIEARCADPDVMAYSVMRNCLDLAAKNRDCVRTSASEILALFGTMIKDGIKFADDMTNYGSPRG